MIDLKWEQVGEGTCQHRAAVHGGWLLRFYQYNHPFQYVFIADPGHTWGRLEEKRKNLETVYKDLEEMNSTNTKPRIEEKWATTSFELLAGDRACPTCYGQGKTSSLGSLIEAETCIACNGTGIDRG